MNREGKKWVGKAGLALVLALLATLPLVGGCSGGPPPDETLFSLGAEVGGAAQDETDFNSLLSTYATEGYAEQTDPELVNYQLFLTGKAADLGLNEAEPGAIEVEVNTNGDRATAVFLIVEPRGLFAVADVSRIEVDMVQTDAEDLPWKIDEIRLER